MIYKLIVNATFLAIGYYIGKEVGRNEQLQKSSARLRTSATTIDNAQPAKQPVDKPDS